METDVTAAEQQQFLTFFLAGEEYAIEILKVREILEYDIVTRVPQTPIWIQGVFNLRGSVVPAIDLALKFGLQETPITPTTCIVILESRQNDDISVLGVVVDAVNQVIEPQPGDIEPPPSFGTQTRADYLLGMVKMGRKFALMLDIDKVLSTEELLQVEQAAVSPEEDQGEDGSASPASLIPPTEPGGQDGMKAESDENRPG
jgi:purine-binding chemotaxis protein CheW